MKYLRNIMLKIQDLAFDRTVTNADLNRLKEE